MKIASWNVNSLRVRLPQVLDWLAVSQVDVLCLQETKLTDADFPAAEITACGYHVSYRGQKAYNGVATLSRVKAEDVCDQAPGVDTEQKRLLATTVDGIRIINLYVVNGEEPGSDKYEFKLDWLAAVTDFIQKELTQNERVVVLGDFNIAPTDADVHDPELWRGRILCSDAEREALQCLLALGFVDTFRLFTQPDGIFSWWDYRGNALRHNQGLRIDLILASHDLAQYCIQSGVDKEPRSWERPSDHAPVVAEFSF